jgi:single-stranded-DNA-specific exonuclease
MMQTQWDILQPDQDRVREIQQTLECQAITATVIANRKFGSVDRVMEFIHPTLQQLPSPFQLDGMEAAVERICHAVEKGEPILVIGDYDADGVTATAVITGFLRASGARVEAHIPHRIHEGYGFDPRHVVQVANPMKAGLIITVDCGSSSHEAVAAANRFGIDAIITDHHNIEGSLPDAQVIINPKSIGQPPEFKDLAGVGVAFYLTVALRMRLRDRGWWLNRSEPNLKSYCDLVALGTVADIVPLIGVNRILTKTGLGQMRLRRRPGISALLDISGVQHESITTEDIAFRLAPRINAAGRISHAKYALDLLGASDKTTAIKMADTLNGLNQRRQAIEGQIFEHIVSQLESRPELKSGQSVLMAGADWHEGVLGIVASKLVAHYNLPVVLISTQNGIGKGSGRSIPSVNLFKALSQCSHLLERFGGHRLAAGLSVKPENIDLLRTALESAIEKMVPGGGDVAQLTIDSALSFEQITPQLMDELEQLEPFGLGNPAPVFWTQDVHVQTATIFKNRHRRMRLVQDNTDAPPIGAVQFNLGPETPRPNFFDRLAFRLQWNHFRGNKEIQMIVEDF